jgi:glycine oxidase
MLAPHIEGHLAAMLALGCGSLALYDAYVDRLRAESGQPIEYRRCGTLQVARTAAEGQVLSELSAQLAARSVEHALLDGAGTRALEPALAPDICAGLLIPEHAYVKVRDLMKGLQEAASRRGVELISAHVDAINMAAGGAQLRLETRVLEADVVVVAAGSWSAPLGSPPLPVRPIRGQLVHLRFPAAPLSRLVWGEGCYMVPWADGSLLVGATSEDVGFDETATAAGVAALREAASLHLPGAADALLEDVRVGLRPATADGLPLIGRSSTMPALLYATGHYRNGVLLTPLTAALIADLVMSGREGRLLALTRPSRFGL